MGSRNFTLKFLHCAARDSLVAPLLVGDETWNEARLTIRQPLLLSRILKHFFGGCKYVVWVPYDPLTPEDPFACAWPLVEESWIKKEVRLTKYKERRRVFLPSWRLGTNCRLSISLRFLPCSCTDGGGVERKSSLSTCFPKMVQESIFFFVQTPRICTYSLVCMCVARGRPNQTFMIEPFLCTAIWPELLSCGTKRSLSCYEYGGKKEWVIPQAWLTKD